ncbi:SAM-dependent DNA methyltransferase [Candidatus Gottesmanbacteria bacterium]|nr:SAM-dependent DNA methyltransferase [Candidatus Gottesmanbacteria bacterium]
MFEQSFKNIDDILHRDAGCATELDYIEQTSWILFLKYLDNLEEIKKKEAVLAGREYKYIINPEYRWNVWAEPKKPDGSLDINKALTGDDLIIFINRIDDKNNGLFQYLKKFKLNASGPDTIEYKIGEIFSELKNKIESGYRLREILNIVDTMHFRTDSEKHELSHLYEAKIKNMGNAGRNGGEFYTPRPLIRTIVKVVDPKIGNTIYDGACGSAGFLVEAFDYLNRSKELTTTESELLQKHTFYGKEIKSLAYIIGVMNMILHGIEAPNILHTNTLAQNINDIQDKDRVDIVLANPPFGAGIGREIQQNFPIKTGETAYLFLQHFIKMLKAGGKAGIVIKNTFLSNADNASVSLRKLLLESCNLQTVLDLPGGTFLGVGVKTVVLFFEKGSSTKKIWYYHLNLDRMLGKNKPLNEKDLAKFVELHQTKAESENSWTIDITNIDSKIYDLQVKNPHKKDESPIRNPKEIIDEIEKLDVESAKILETINSLI